MPRANPINGGPWGIMGGAFDPVHYGHLILAEQAGQVCHLAGVLFVPSFQPPHRDRAPVASFEDRVEMTRLATDDNDGFVVSDIERDLDGPGYTLKLVDRLRQEYPQVEWSVILGTDNIALFDQWYKPEELVNVARIVVGNRPGFEHEYKNSEWADRVEEFAMPMIDISATRIRQRVAAGDSIRYLVPESIRRYVGEKGLYR